MNKLPNDILIYLHLFSFRRDIQGFLLERSPKPPPCLGLLWKLRSAFVPLIPGRWTWMRNASFTCKATLQVSSALARTPRHAGKTMHGLNSIRMYIYAGLSGFGCLVYHTGSHMAFLQWSELGTVEWANWIVDGWGQTVWKRIKGLQSESPSLKGPACLGSLCVKCWVGSYWEANGSPAWPTKAPVHSYLSAQLAFRKDECHHTVYGCYLSFHKEPRKLLISCDLETHEVKC